MQYKAGDTIMTKFHHVYIEIMNICQFNCSFCPKTTRAPKIMSPERFKHVLEEVRPYTSLIYLHVLGEPLMHPQLEELLRIAKEYDFTVNITTNGALLNEKSDILLHSDVISKVSVSLHSMEDSGQRELDLDTYMKNVFSFSEKAIQHNITTIYRLWDTNTQKNEILDYIKQRYPEVSLTNTVSPQNGIKLEYRVFLHQANQFTWPIQEQLSTNDDGYCLGLKSHIAILADETVVPCCLDSEGKIALGNLSTNSLKEILEGERSMAIAEGFRKHKAVEELCKSCSYKKRFDNRI